MLRMLEKEESGAKADPTPAMPLVGATPPRALPGAAVPRRKAVPMPKTQKMLQKAAKPKTIALAKDEANWKQKKEKKGEKATSAPTSRTPLIPEKTQNCELDAEKLCRRCAIAEERSEDGRKSRRSSRSTRSAKRRSNSIAATAKRKMAMKYFYVMCPLVNYPHPLEYESRCNCGRNDEIEIRGHLSISHAPNNTNGFNGREFMWAACGARGAERTLGSLREILGQLSVVHLDQLVPELRLESEVGGKKPDPLLQLVPDVAISRLSRLKGQAKPVDPVIDKGAQVQQLVNFICVQEFTTFPTIRVVFTYTNNMGQLTTFNKTLYLPIFLSKFFEATVMSSDQFFARWKQLSQPVQESQKIFTARYSMETDQVRAKLMCLGCEVLNDVDPNPENFVLAGIIHTQMQQIGTLIRLEPNKQTKMYRLTVRSSRDVVAKLICDVVAEQF